MDIVSIMACIERLCFVRSPNVCYNKLRQSFTRTRGDVLQVPIICICNDKYNQKLKSLRNHCLELEFRCIAATITSSPQSIPFSLHGPLGHLQPVTFRQPSGVMVSCVGA